MSIPALSSPSSTTFSYSFASPEHFNPFSVSIPFDAADPSWRKELPPLPPMNITAVSDLLTLKREDSLLQHKSPYPFQILAQTTTTANTAAFNPLFLTRRQTSNVVTPGSIDNYSPHSSSSSTVQSPGFNSPHLLLQQSSPSSDDQSVTEGDGDDDPPFQLQLQSAHTPDTTNSSASSAIEDTPNSTTTPSPLDFENSPALLPMNNGMSAAETEEGISADDSADIDRKPFNGFSLSSADVPQAVSSSFSLSSSSSSSSSFSTSSSSSSFSFSSLSLSGSAASNRSAYLSTAHLSYNFHSIKMLPSPPSVLFAIQVSASRNHKILENKAGTQFMLKEDQKSKRWPRKYLSVWPTVESALRWVAFCLSEWPELRFVLGPPGDEIRLVVVEDTDAKLHHEVYSLVRSEQEVETAVRGVRKKRHESRYATARVRLIHLIPTAICSASEEGLAMHTLITPADLINSAAAHSQGHEVQEQRDMQTTQHTQTTGRRRQRNTATSSASASAAGSSGSSASSAGNASSGQRAAYGVKIEGEMEGEEGRDRSEDGPQPGGGKRKKPRNSLLPDGIAPPANTAALSEELQRLLAASSDLPPTKNDLQLHSAMSAESQAQLTGLQTMDSTEAAAAIVPPMLPIPPLPMNRNTSLSFSTFIPPTSMPAAAFTLASSAFSTATTTPAFTPTSATTISSMTWAAASSSSFTSSNSSSADLLPTSPMTYQLASQSTTTAAVGSMTTIAAWPQLHLPLPSLPALMTAAVNAPEPRECLMANASEDEDLRSFGFALPLPSTTPSLSQQNSFTNSLSNAYSYQPFQWSTAALDYSFSEGADGERSIFPEPESKTPNMDAIIKALHPARKHPNSGGPVAQVPVALPALCSGPCSCCRELKEAALMSELQSVLLVHCTLSAALIDRFLRESVDDICCVEDLIEFWESAGATRLCSKAALTEIQAAKISSCRRKLLNANSEQLRSMLQQCEVSQPRQAAIAKCVEVYHAERTANNASSKNNSETPEIKADHAVSAGKAARVSGSPKSSKRPPACRARVSRSMSVPAIHTPTVSHSDSSSGSVIAAKSLSLKSDQSRSSFDQCPPSVLSGLAAQRRLWQRWTECVQSVKAADGKEFRKASQAVEKDFVFEVLSDYSASLGAPLCNVRSLPLPLRLSLANLGDCEYYQLMRRALAMVQTGQAASSASTNEKARLLVQSLLALNHLSRRWRSAQKSANEAKRPNEGKNAFSAIVEHCSTSAETANRIWEWINFQSVRTNASRLDVAIRISGHRQLTALFYVYRKTKS